MRSRALRTAGVSFTAIALATTLSTSAGAEAPSIKLSASAPTSAAAVGPSAKSCFSNLDAPAGNIISSQNFEAAFDIYDNAAADDVTLKKKCKLKEVSVLGAYFEEGMGPADSETVTIYKDKKGKPGKVVSEQTVEGADNAGSFVIPLKKVKMKKGTYWVSVVVNMDAGTKGQWGWAASTNGIGAEALWQNPGDGFGGGCTKWSNMQTCIGITGAPDMSFALN